jgi:hypothetical protein
MAFKPLMAGEGLRGGLNGGFKVAEGKCLTDIMMRECGVAGFGGGMVGLDSVGGGREGRQVGPT